jgi:Fic family protein
MSNTQKGKKQSIETIQKRLSKISELNKDENHRRKFGEKLKKKVYQYDLEWNLIREYDSVTEASDILDVNRASICKAIKGIKNKTCKGFYWSYTKKQDKLV